jgi:arsenite methyltransferase
MSVLASPLVGPTGKAIGIDRTPAMIERARTNAQNGGYTNVEFYLGTIDHLPLADGSVDCVISNCVINLAPDKPAVFREIARVLKAGGRLAVSDIALKAELPVAVAQSMAAYVGCIGGAIKIDDYRSGLLAAGFEHVEIVDSGADLNAYAKVENQAGCCSPAMDPPNDSTVLADACCSTNAPTSASLHENLTKLLAEYDVNAAAASVKVYAVKPLQRDTDFHIHHGRRDHGPSPSLTQERNCSCPLLPPQGGFDHPPRDNRTSWARRPRCLHRGLKQTERLRRRRH